MGAMAGGGTTGSGTPWTAQQFSAWKRREKGRLVKLRGYLEEKFTEVQGGGRLMNQLAEAEAAAKALRAEIKPLESASRKTVDKAPGMHLRARQMQVENLQEKVVRARLFKGAAQSKLEIARGELPRLEKAAAENERLTEAKAEAIRRLAAKRASLAAAYDNVKKIRERFDGLSKLVGSVQQGPEMLRTTLPLIPFVDRFLADLEKKPPPAWVVEGVTAYVNELGRKNEAKLKREKELKKELAGWHKQLEKDSKELADLQGSEAATLKRIEALERRLEREEERVLAECKFIYKKLWNKRNATPGLSKRERSFLKEYHIPFRSEHWSDNDPNHNNRTWTSDPKHKDWATDGVEFSAKLRTSARKIEELEADIEELKPIPKRILELKSLIRKFEKDIATADKANAAAGGWPKGKAPRIGYIANAHAFEKYMAEWMRWLGWDDAKAMPVGPDEGIDVKATGALGQAKHWDTEVGIEEVQRHNGVCEGIQKYGRVFLSKSGYTPQAIKWANDRDLPLFEMKAGSKDAGVVASTKAGEKLLKVGAKAMKGNKRN